MEALAAAELDAAMAGVGEARWGEIVNGPFGPTPVAAMAALAALRTMVHDGRLNHTHQLHGDPRMHWT